MTSAVVSPLTTQKTKIVIEKGDSAAISHYWRPEDKKILNKIKEFLGPSILLPNNEITTSTSTGKIPLSPVFSKTATTVMILPKLVNSSLIS